MDDKRDINLFSEVASLGAQVENDSTTYEITSMAEDKMVLNLKFKVRRGRMQSMTEQAHGEIRRARRNDRPALMCRWAKRIAEECVILKVDP